MFAWLALLLWPQAGSQLTPELKTCAESVQRG